MFNPPHFRVLQSDSRRDKIAVAIRDTESSQKIETNYIRASKEITSFIILSAVERMHSSKFFIWHRN